MRTSIIASCVFAFAFLLLSSCGSPSGPKSYAQQPGVVLLKEKSEVSSASRTALNEVLAKYSLQNQESLLSASGIFKWHTDRSNYFGKEEQILADLKATQAFAIAELDRIVPPAVTPNDPGFKNQWHHQSIHSQAAWNISTGSTNIKTAICDTGFDLENADLKDNFSLPGINLGIPNDTMTGAPHGTETSGSMAARGNNGMGVAGVAWVASLLPIKVGITQDGSSSYSVIAKCIDEASQAGAKVISISYGLLYASEAVDEAAALAQSRGSLVVIAAGNESTDLSNFKKSSHYILVAASDSDDRLASFSNFGSIVDLAAPGVGILTTAPNGVYKSVSGTSFATPIVSGAASLIFAVNPRLSPQAVASILTSSSRASSVNAHIQSGVLDLAAALKAAQSTVKSLQHP